MHRRYRLRRKSDFDRLHRRGKRWYHSLATLVICPNDSDLPRLGFTASRRVGSAVDRNRVKRQFREAVRKRLGSMKPGYDCLFIITPQAVSAGSKEIELSVENLLHQAGLFKGVSLTEVPEQ